MPSKTDEEKSRCEQVLDVMPSKTDEEKSRCEQVMENFDMIFAQINDISIQQQDLKKGVNETKEEQKLISKQVQANGQAVASLTLWQMETEAAMDHAEGNSMVSAEEPQFDNIFAAKQYDIKPEHSRRSPKQQNKESLPHHTLPKMQFPTFDGNNPKIWIDNCINYFTIYKVEGDLKVTAATMHLQENAAKWWQAYKQGNKTPS
jgi:hypothetical protein